MKHFLKILSITACVFTLSACETMNGLQEDLGNINLSQFSLDNLGDWTTPDAVSGDETYSDLLIDGDCPQIEILDDLATYPLMEEQGEAGVHALISTALIDEIQSGCTFGEKSVTVEMDVAFNGINHDASMIKSASFAYPYFVAVTSNTGTIEAKEVFTAPINYKRFETPTEYSEKLRQIIPINSRKDASRYRIKVGFQLTQDQLAYNRQVIEDARLEAIRIAQEKAEAEAAAMAAAALKAQQEAQQAAIKVEPAAASESASVQTSDSSSDNPDDSNAPLPLVPKAEVIEPQRDGPFDMFKSE